MKLAYFSLFLSGIFFGGAIDHVIFALMRSQATPYNIRLGIAGNWWMAMFDLALTGLFFRPFYKNLKKGQNNVRDV